MSWVRVSPRAALLFFLGKSVVLGFVDLHLLCLHKIRRVFVIYEQTTRHLQAEYVRSDIEDTKKSLKETIVPAVSGSATVPGSAVFTLVLYSVPL